MKIKQIKDPEQEGLPEAQILNHSAVRYTESIDTPAQGKTNRCQGGLIRKPDSKLMVIEFKSQACLKVERFQRMATLFLLQACRNGSIFVFAGFPELVNDHGKSINHRLCISAQASI